MRKWLAADSLHFLVIHYSLPRKNAFLGNEVRGKAAIAQFGQASGF
jgi:hypothetical protein